jgi:hypothetical protein
MGPRALKVLEERQKSIDPRREKLWVRERAAERAAVIRP